MKSFFTITLLALTINSFAGDLCVDENIVERNTGDWILDVSGKLGSGGGATFKGTLRKAYILRVTFFKPEKIRVGFCDVKYYRLNTGACKERAHRVYSKDPLDGKYRYYNDYIDFSTVGDRIISSGFRSGSYYYTLSATKI